MLFFFVKIFFIEAYLERCEGREREKYVLRGHGLLQSGNREAEELIGKHGRYLLEGEHGLEDPALFLLCLFFFFWPCTVGSGLTVSGVWDHLLDQGVGTRLARCKAKARALTPILTLPALLSP